MSSWSSIMNNTLATTLALGNRLHQMNTGIESSFLRLTVRYPNNH